MTAYEVMLWAWAVICVCGSLAACLLVATWIRDVIDNWKGK